MACAMGGHVAESLIFGEVTTGASNDLQKATEMARRMVCLYGMSETLGAVAFAADGALGYASTFGEPSPNVSPEVARAIDEAVRDLLAEARGRALAILTRQARGAGAHRPAAHRARNARRPGAARAAGPHRLASGRLSKAAVPLWQ